MSGSVTTSPDREEAWKATASSPATVQVNLHGIMGEDKCTYFPDYPNLFILPESDNLCGYVHAIDESDRMRASPDKGQAGIQPPTIPSRPRAAYLGRSGPRQDLELLRRNLQVERNAKTQLRSAENEMNERRKDAQEQEGVKIKKNQREKENLMKELREQSQKDMDKLQEQIDTGKERELVLKQDFEDEKAKGEVKLAKLKARLEADFKLELESAMKAKDAIIAALEAEHALCPEKMADKLENLEAKLRAECEESKVAPAMVGGTECEESKKELLKDAEDAKSQMLRLLMEEVVLAGPALVARVQAKHDKLAK